MTTLEIPGKLFIAGEYGVTRPGGLALVMAVRSDFRVTVADSNGLSRLSTNVGLTDFQFDAARLPVSADKGWEFAFEAYKAADVASSRQLHIHIDSGLGLGESKKGYGSSAAVVVGVLKAVSRHLGLPLSPDALFDKAFAVHRRVQGSGSGGDVAAISYGGFIEYQLGGFVKRIEIPYPAYVISTGKAVKTHDKLDLKLSDDFYSLSDELVRQAADSKDFKSFKKALADNQQLLIDHLPANYLTDPMKAALDTVNAQENFIAKVSGAGFGENLVVFAENPQPAELKALREALAKHNLTLENLEIYD